MASKGSNGGIKGALTTMLMLILIAGAISAWARANNIDSFASGYDYFKAWSDKANEKYNECIDAEGLTISCDSDRAVGKKPGSGNSNGENGNNSDENSGSTGGGAENNGENNTEMPVVSEFDKLMGTLSEITIKDPEKVEYNRKDWKHWTGSPCNTREEVLKRDGKNVTFDEKSCKILTGTWISSYDNVEFTEASKLDIDHIIPLSYAAKHGGNAWSPEIKERFANDKSQLIAVSAKENRTKGDKGPGEYMPPETSYHCEYSTKWIKTADTYGLTISAKDRTALEKGLQTCEK